MLGLVLLLLSGQADAYVLTITPGPREIYLQVGAGTYVGGNYDAGGTPATNATINNVSLTVPAAKAGNGAALAMTSDSGVANSFYDGFAVCNPPNQVYVGGWSRPGGGGGAAVLSVTSPGNLTQSGGGGVIPFSQISWTSTANGDTTADVAAGSFNGGGTVALTTIAANTWVEDCLTFSYKNAAVVPSGTYTGRAVYTLSLP